MTSWVSGAGLALACATPRLGGADPVVLATAAGDVGSDGTATLWAQTSGACELRFEVGREAGSAARRYEAVSRAADGFTGRVTLRGLPPGEALAWKVVPVLDGRDGSGLRGRLRVPGDGLRFVFGGDVCGQGFGIDRHRGGFTIFEAMRHERPDFFLCSGDAIYADNPLPAERTLDDGSVWRNLVTPEKAKVAESLEEFRGQYRYNLLDDPYRRFLSEVPLVAQWDDHETTNNWYPGEVLADPRYTERRVDVLAARARRAFLEFMPMREGPIYRRIPCGRSVDLFVLDQRSYRGPNGTNTAAAGAPGAKLLGREQLEWLVRGLRGSKARYKLIAADMPVGLVVRDGETAFEGLANGSPLVSGREHEWAEVLTRTRDVSGVVVLTADVHYAAAHRYDPSRATHREFRPFWEFVAGPLHAGTFGPGTLDASFGPKLEFLGIPEGMRPNRPPSEGLQFFGLGEVGSDGVLRVALCDASGRRLFETAVV